ncbi:hypothetical protein ACNFCI_11770 [Pseudomonas sp. NY15356]|uniref:DUF7716 domain-containing protein n=1 Tax=unclassified Pseudomonas TaxID=196821 RepID=UPI003A8BFBD8
MLLKDKFYALSELIEHVKVFAEQDDDFCLYGQDQDHLDLKMQYFVADYPSVKDDKEIYPESVKKAGLSYLYAGQQFVDVVTLLAEQKPDASYDDYVKSLNYYQDNDEFIDL